jgi:hypothetical protein
MEIVYSCFPNKRVIKEPSRQQVSVFLFKVCCDKQEAFQTSYVTALQPQTANQTMPLTGDLGQEIGDKYDIKQFLP